MKTLMLLALIAGCALDPQPDGAVETSSQAHATAGHLDHAEDINAALYPPIGVQNYCYVSGATTWCQDYYTSKWCTSYTTGSAWDHTGCTWRGWNSAGEFCGTNYPGYTPNYDGWQWGGTHTHCD